MPGFGRKRILLITSSYPGYREDRRAAAGSFVKDFADELADKAEVTVLTQKTDQGSSGVDESKVRVIRFRWAGTETPLSTLRFPQDIVPITSVILRGVFAVLKAGRRHNVDLTLAFWAIPSGLWALFLKWAYGTRYAVWCLGSDVWEYERGTLRRWFLRVILKQAHTLYADGYQLSADVESLTGKKCHFLSTSRRLPVSVSVNADLEPDKRNYVFIGRYHPNKGPDVLLEAISKLEPSTLKKVHFHFFGGGPLKKSLEELIRKRRISGVVSLGGYICAEEVVAYLRACHALIIPSRIESIPVVLSDALQNGSPVIVTDVGDMGHLIRKYQAGIVVQPDSPEEMARAISQDVIKEEDFSEGRKRLLELFDLPKTVERFVSDHY
ncbi:MAG: glycosyltransferase [Thermodesulfobacteriota bacterium]|nr:glycosyltransferase [Thermodesulfobacteriota bacterium]